MLSSTLPIALDGTLPACLTIRSQVSSHDSLNHTPEHALKYTPNCTRWHAPSVLDYTLPSKIWRHSQKHLRVRTQVHLRVARKYTRKMEDTPNLTWLYAPMYAPACSIQRLAELPKPGTGWRVVGGGGRKHGVGWHYSLNLIFIVPTATRTYDTSWWWCWQLQPLILQER